jgi:multicomponent Na+:H+ antiporter subunit G
MSYVADFIVGIGAIFALLGALGVLRFPDLYTRLHAASKAGPLGVGLILVGAGLHSGDPLIVLRCVIGLLFLILVSPVSAHLLARAALRSGVPPSKSTSIDEFTSSH